MTAVLLLTLAAQLIEGTPGSPVRVVIYEDLQCPDCAAFRVMMDKHLLPKYGAQVEFRHREFPLAKHTWARQAAIAARYFSTAKPGLGIEFRRQTMASIKSIPPGEFPKHVEAFAKTNGLDPAAALKALDDPKLAEAVEADYQDGVARGVAKTPTVFVNGKPFIETFTLEEISKAIDEALAAK